MCVQAFFQSETGIQLGEDVRNGFAQLMLEEGYEQWEIDQDLPQLLSTESPLLGVVFAFNEDGQVIGKCTIEKRGRETWVLGGAFVAEAFRGKRVFSGIMDRVNCEAQARGITNLDCSPAEESSTTPDYWRPALKRWGFREIRGRDDEWRKPLRERTR